MANDNLFQSLEADVLAKLKDPQTWVFLLKLAASGVISLSPKNHETVARHLAEEVQQATSGVVLP